MIDTSTMSLDQAQDDFRVLKTEKSAATYLMVAAVYFSDEMIGKATFHAAIDEVMAWRNNGRKS